MTKSIPLTRGKFALVDDDDYEYLNQWKWHLKKGYALRSKNDKPRIIMHRLIMNTPLGMETDHINHNKLDNRKENLRICTNNENHYNLKMRKNNSTGYKGVCLKRKTNKYFAQICHNYKDIHLGYFASPMDAAKAYNEAAIKYYGKFANLNIINDA